MYVAGYGLQLIETAETLLDRSFRTFARTAPQRPDQGPPEVDFESAGLAGAAVDVIVGQFLFKTGVALIGTERELGDSLVDIFA